MRRCLELAGKGVGHVAPNPMVGAVIVRQDKIIGEGYHRVFGDPHAEVNAINAAGDQRLLKDATLFVNLEPCSHYGKTPPCSKLIIEKGIRHVVIGAADPNKLVDGGGIDMLRKAGCHVETDILQDDCIRLNRFYYTYHTRKRPYIILKWAQTADGFISPSPEQTVTGTVRWITGEVERMLVHKWRSEVQSIMAGTGTLLTDNPRLTVRDWPGKNPVRIIPDRRGRLPRTLNVFNEEADTIVFSTSTGEEGEHIKYVGLSSEQAPLSEIIGHLFNTGIQSLLVEGGAALLESFITEGLWDEARVFTGPITYVSGLKAPSLPCNPDESLVVSDSRLDIYLRR